MTVYRSVNGKRAERGIFLHIIAPGGKEKLVYITSGGVNIIFKEK